MVTPLEMYHINKALEKVYPELKDRTVNDYLRKLEYPERIRKIMNQPAQAKVIPLNPISKQAELWPDEAMAVIAILVNRLGGYVEINAKEIIDIDMDKVKTGRVLEMDAMWIEVE